nr:hypothetical protein CFP56_16838 [Quercus suber]
MTSIAIEGGVGARVLLLRVRSLAEVTRLSSTDEPEAFSPTSPGRNEPPGRQIAAPRNKHQRHGRVSYTISTKNPASGRLCISCIARQPTIHILLPFGAGDPVLAINLAPTNSGFLFQAAGIPVDGATKLNYTLPPGYHFRYSFLAHPYLPVNRPYSSAVAWHPQMHPVLLRRSFAALKGGPFAADAMLCLAFQMSCRCSLSGAHRPRTSSIYQTFFFVCQAWMVGWPPFYAAAQLSTKMKILSKDITNELCDQQPLPFARLESVTGSQHLNAAHSAPNVDYGEPTGQSVRSHHRPPSLRPLQLGNSSLLPRRSSHQRQHSESVPPCRRPSIGAPTAFRRLEYTERQRSSLIPLRLGPVILKETLPSQEPQPSRPPSYISADVADHVLRRADSTIDMSSGVAAEGSEHANDRTSHEAAESGEELHLPEPSLAQEQMTPVGLDLSRDHAPRPMVSTRSSSSSLRRQAIETNAASAFARFNGASVSRERPAIRRKMSLSSLRRSPGENEEPHVDQEILELNTIVEEKRVEAVRPPTPDDHRPAIAPTMQVRARSETLSDIGSAFSRPHASRDTISSSIFPSRPVARTLERTSSQPRSRSASRSRSRVSGWLSNILSTSFSSAPIPPEPFYKCQPRGSQHMRAYSERSLCSSTLTEIDSPALTVASSSISKGHSRSITADSTIPFPAPVYGTPISFSAKAPQPQNQESFPEILHSPSQVGLAL